MELALFGLLALVAVVSAAAMIQSRNAIHSALFLILNFGCVALLFLMLDAPFISMVQIAVYAGAIMVLFLFVIMLLGAEQSSDIETRRLNWLTPAATVLAALLLGALGIGLVSSGGLDLPEPSGEAPRLRLIHAADVQDPVTVALNGIPVFSDVYFGDVTEFTDIDLKEDEPSTSLSLTDASGATVLETSLDLSNGQVVSVVAYGTETLQTALINNSFAPTTVDHARLSFLNLYTEEAIVLVDLGVNRVFDANGSEITDRVILEAVPYGAVLASNAAFKEGDYTYGFYRQRLDGTWEELTALRNPELGTWPIEADSEQIIILAPDYNSTANAGVYRPMIFDSLQEELIIHTNESFGSPGDIGKDLFVDYLLPVNLVGFLLLVALVGVIVLTRPEILAAPRRSNINRRRKVSRPLVSVISQQTGQDVLVDTPKLEDPSSGE